MPKRVIYCLQAAFNFSFCSVMGLEILRLMVLGAIDKAIIQRLGKQLLMLPSSSKSHDCLATACSDWRSGLRSWILKFKRIRDKSPNWLRNEMLLKPGQMWKVDLKYTSFSMCAQTPVDQALMVPIKAFCVLPPDMSWHLFNRKTQYHVCLPSHGQQLLSQFQWY